MSSGVELASVTFYMPKDDVDGFGDRVAKLTAQLMRDKRSEVPEERARYDEFLAMLERFKPHGIERDDFLAATERCLEPR